MVYAEAIGRFDWTVHHGRHQRECSPDGRRFVGWHSGPGARLGFRRSARLSASLIAGAPERVDRQLCIGKARSGARVATVQVSQDADLRDVVNMLGQHRRDEVHRGEGLSPMRRTQLEDRVVIQRVD